MRIKLNCFEEKKTHQYHSILRINLKFENYKVLLSVFCYSTLYYYIFLMNFDFVIDCCRLQVVEIMIFTI